MQFLEYYSSALRHLDVCKLMLEKLSTMGVKQEKRRQRLMLDIYYLSGYIIETMISYSHFVSLGWRKNNHIETYPLYDKGFKTHNLSVKLTFAVSKGHCDYSGIILLGQAITNATERKMFYEWSEKVRYQSPKTISKLDFNEEDLKHYLSDIEKMFNQLRLKYFV